jgi:3-hydroxy-3-methylglutaryl CoA synthase
MNGSIGITGFGAFIPRLRLDRAAAVAATSWADPGLRGLGRGERAICDWDEDSVTLAVEAARDCLTGRSRGSVSRVVHASTSAPFADRQSSSVVAAALGLDTGIAALDVAQSQRAGTSALLLALASTQAAGTESLVVAAEHRRCKPGSARELLYGDGAAALTIGHDGVVAKVLGAASSTHDFVDHYRRALDGFDHDWEERWVRDEGYLKLVPPVVADALRAAGKEASTVRHFLLPCIYSRVREAVAKASGIAAEAVRDNLGAVCGETGAAHAMLMLVATLEQAAPGETIVVVGFGQGVDAIVLETTSELPKLPARLGVRGHLLRRTAERNYTKFQSLNQIIQMNWGTRSEVDRKTAISAAYRNRELLAMVGGRCRQCGTVQFPRSALCVDPGCGAEHSQDPVPLAETTGRIASVTSDWLALSKHPPQRYGMIELEPGTKLMMQITADGGVEPAVGMPVRLQFRIKEIDPMREYQSYFWKASLDLPVEERGR